MSAQAVADGYRKATETYMQIVDQPAAWKGKVGKNWDTFWESLTRAQAIDSSLRRTGFDGCVYGEDKKCPAIAPVSCEGCVDLSHPLTNALEAK